MGAAASVECRFPIDASDVGSSLETAQAELIRLRGVLGHLAKDYGVDTVCYDASDVVLGEDKEADRVRCVREISHIRQLLNLNTQAAVRGRRGRGHIQAPPVVPIESKIGDNDNYSASDSDTNSD